ncbi:uncharacterized protein E0L32_007366 [Thyridium curvatum]|uniref:FAD-binding domain-containing protein n=1 Tax=Thyridium curvatum TaxID=1093900 RepID=A0A507B4S6_9PEZI|nr:uncharacterized protein E0L32_007366 [Thyridium curvatum]TPX11868.1 hypothetical protein E0L32_007366 [Thyridium curvatum]
MSNHTENVAIIGGGIAGMALALCLHSLSVPCTVYEMRKTEAGSRTAGGGMMVGGNALAILDKWGVYEKMVPKGYQFNCVYLKGPDEKTTECYPFGGKDLFGYDGLRIYRQEYLDSLYEVCQAKGVTIEFGAKFTRVVEETESGVTFELADGTTRTASMLVGADGIHSKVREYACPGVKTKFMGIMAVTSEVVTEKLRIPAEKDYRFPLQIVTDFGMVAMAPQTPDGSQMLIGTQFPTEDRSREDWERLFADKEGLKKILQKDLDKWPDTIKSGIENIKVEAMHVWPFQMLPPLPSWTSLPHRRVAVLGDAAHAVPPTSGQGASMGIEDVYVLGLLIFEQKKHPEIGWQDTLAFWQQMRQERMGEIMELTRLLNNKRLPSVQQADLKKEDIWQDESATNPRQMAWLYAPKFEERVGTWVKAQVEKPSS